MVFRPGFVWRYYAKYYQSAVAIQFSNPSWTPVVQILSVWKESNDDKLITNSFERFDWKSKVGDRNEGLPISKPF